MGLALHEGLAFLCFERTNAPESSVTVCGAHRAGADLDWSTTKLVGDGLLWLLVHHDVFHYEAHSQVIVFFTDDSVKLQK